jgi:ribokinase
MGSKFESGFGGKGANQAVSAARLGARVAMVSALGEDAEGTSTRAHLAAEGVDAAEVRSVAGERSGCALIFVDARGENCIVVCPGANEAVSQEWVEASLERLNPPAGTIVVCQNEIPLTATATALRTARARGCTTVWNPAPCPAETDGVRDVLASVDVLVVNRGEAETLAGSGEGGVEGSVEKLLRAGCKTVIVTLGAEGCNVVTADAATLHIPAFTPPAPVIDTTGAGDCFVGALCVALGEGKRPADAARFAVHAAALSVTKRGTQSSYPSRADIHAE